MGWRFRWGLHWTLHIERFNDDGETEVVGMSRWVKWVGVGLAVVGIAALVVFKVIR